MISIAFTNEKLSSEAVRYWKKSVLANLKIGVEIEFELDGDVNDLSITLKRKLKPSDSFNFSENGVYQVAGDGSLRNGIELKTSGRRLDFINLYMQYKTYVDLFPIGVKITSRCGLHNHVLMDYGTHHNSLESPMPGVIFKNFAQLLRRHAPELVWITSTMKHETGFTRYEEFCKADSLYRFTPISRDVGSFCERLKNGGEGNGRYKFMNVRPMEFRGNKISKLHFELRFPDGSIYPAQIAAQNILYGALLIKAIELSELGVIDTGTEEEWAETKELYSKVRHGQGYSGDRMSSFPGNDSVEKLIARSDKMLRFLKSCIAQYDVRAYSTLKILAQNPISMLRRTKTDKEINRDFHALMQSMYVLDTDKFETTIKLINLMEHTGAVSPKQWSYQISAKLGKTMNELQNELEELNKIKPLEFDIELGTYIFK